MRKVTTRTSTSENEEVWKGGEEWQQQKREGIFFLEKREKKKMRVNQMGAKEERGKRTSYYY